MLDEARHPCRLGHDKKGRMPPTGLKSSLLVLLLRTTECAAFVRLRPGNLTPFLGYKLRPQYHSSLSLTGATWRLERKKSDEEYSQRAGRRKAINLLSSAWVRKARTGIEFRSQSTPLSSTYNATDGEHYQQQPSSSKNAEQQTNNTQLKAPKTGVVSSNGNKADDKRTMRYEVIEDPNLRVEDYEKDDCVWEVGNVEHDLARLEQAIAYSKAEDHLLESQRMETLDAFAAQRRPVMKDVHHFLTCTLAFSLGFAALQRTLMKIGKISGNQVLLSRLAMFVTVPWDVHFWVVAVAAPLSLRLYKQWTMPPSEPPPPELEKLAPEYHRFLITEWVPPERSCHDYVFCLVEQWSSAVSAMAMLGVFRFLLWASIKTAVYPFRVAPRFHPTTTAAIQLLVRLGAMASVFQFPKLLFGLRREQQPRPVRFDATVLQAAVSSLLAWGVPLGIASDLSKLLGGRSTRTLIVFYGAMVASVSACGIALQRPPEEPSPKRQALFRHLRRGSTFLGVMSAFAVIIYVSLPFLVHFRNRMVTNNWALPHIPWMFVLPRAMVLLASVMPLGHLWALRRIVRLVYTHGLSLSMEPETFHTALENPLNNSQSRMQWRYCLEWRDPQRMSIVLDDIQGEFFTWLFLAGTVQERLRAESRAWHKKKARESDSNIWNLLNYEVKSGIKIDRTQWKKNAMKKLAAWYQADYDAKKSQGKIFDDPLGVAVQQTLGIGLAFNFDHATRLPNEPNSRQLQARAAKSAIKRVQDLNDELIRRGRELEKDVKDPKELAARLEELKEEVDKETKLLADKLSELVPTDRDSVLPGGIDGGKMRFIDGEMTLTDGKLVIQTPSFKRSKVVEDLLSFYDQKHPNTIAPDEDLLNYYEQKHASSTISNDKGTGSGGDEGRRDGMSGTSHVVTKDKSGSGSPEDDFAEAYLKQRFGGGGEASAADDDDDDGMSTILV